MITYNGHRIRVIRPGQHNRGPWRPEEDERLRMLYHHEEGNWTKIAPLMSTHRTPKQCRERWHQNLKPDLAHTPLTEQEQAEVIQLVKERGHRWASIARSLGPHRSDNMVKNWWNGENNRRSKFKMKKRSNVGEEVHPQYDLMNQRRLPPPMRSGNHDIGLPYTGPSTFLLNNPQIQRDNIWLPSASIPLTPLRPSDNAGESIRPGMPSPVHSQMSNTAPSLVTDRGSRSPQPQPLETPRVYYLPSPSLPQPESRAQVSLPSSQPEAFLQSFRHPVVLPQPERQHDGSTDPSAHSISPIQPSNAETTKSKIRVTDILN